MPGKPLLSTPTGNCVDCKQPSNYKVCVPCLKNRKLCSRAPCSSKLSRDSPYSSCYKCTCATKGCSNARDEGDCLYCVECTQEWNVVCHMCQTKITTIPFKTCNECDSKRIQCLRCDKRKALFDVANDASFDYCKFCKCKTFECANEVVGDEQFQHCKACSDCFCVKCKKTFAQLGSDLCRACTPKREEKPECATKQCTNLVGYNQSTKTYYKFCKYCSSK